MAEDVAEKNVFLIELGRRIKTIRRAKKLSRRRVAEVSNVSQRFLSQFEAGEGNISVSRLHSLCEALQVPLDMVVCESRPDSRALQIQSALTHAGAAQIDKIASILGLDTVAHPERDRVALIGLRGAGKSTLGRRLAADLKYELINLDDQVEALAGMRLAEVYSLFGQQGYRRLEREVLEACAEKRDIVVTTGGSIVTDSTNYPFLLGRFLTVWIAASAQEHMNRVIAQGDSRPMDGDESPLKSIQQLLEKRQALYAQAPFTVNTAGRSVEDSCAQLLDCILQYQSV